MRQPGGRERAAETPPPITPEDEASPIPTETIAEGKEIFLDALASQDASEILDSHGLPGVGTRVTVDRGEGPVGGVIEDAFRSETPEIGLAGEGVRIRLDDGSTLEEFIESLREAGTRIEPGESPPGPRKAPQRAVYGLRGQLRSRRDPL